jgi:DNA-binding response OmpR family regulator
MRTVLIIADERSTINLCRDYLAAASLLVLAAESGPKGLELARRASPDIIVLDLTMTGMTSLDMCRALRHESRIPIIMLSQQVKEADKLMALALGVDDYITKPFSPRELVARVQAVLRRTPSSTLAT